MSIPGPRRLFDAAQLTCVEPGVIVVNTGRGGLVGETTLAEGLTLGRSGVMGLGVFQSDPFFVGSPLTAAPSVVLAPHPGGATQEALECTALEVASKVIAALGLSART